MPLNRRGELTGQVETKLIFFRKQLINFRNDYMIVNMIMV